MPEDVNQAVDTQLQDAPQDTPDGQQQDAQKQEEYFLDVDERHRYRTKDDVVRAIQESGQRIGQLTPWQEHAQRYGITDPTNLPRIFDQYLSMKQRLDQLEQQQQRAQQGQDTSKQLDPKDKQNIEYLEQHGFTRKEAIDKVLEEKLGPLQRQIEQLTAQLGQSESVQTNAVIESGRNHLATLMTDAGLPVDNPETNEVIEDAIVAWMEGQSLDRNGNILPGSPLDKFYQGGRAMQDVISQGFERVSKFLNVARIQADGRAQQQSQQQRQRTPRALPKQGAPVPVKKEGEEGTPQRRPGAGGIFQDPSLHEKAFERMQEVNRGG